MRLIASCFICRVLVACNGLQYQQAKRMKDFQVNQSDFDSIAVATFKLIDAKGDIVTIVAPHSIDSRARQALKNVHPVVDAAPGPANTLPTGYFLVRQFSVEEGGANVEGQLGPVTGLMTSANMPDCGKEYSVAFYIEGGDWLAIRSRWQPARKVAIGCLLMRWRRPSSSPLGRRSARYQPEISARIHTPNFVFLFPHIAD